MNVSFMNGRAVSLWKTLRTAALVAGGFMLLLGAEARNVRAQDTTGGAGAKASVERPLVGPARFDTRFRHDTTTVNGVRLHYVTGGEGPALLLLHGWPFTWYEWHPVMPALAERFTVIAPDLRGIGDSEKPQEGYRKTNVAADLRALVRHLDHDEARVVGIDIGAMIAFTYAARYGEAAVPRLVIGEALMPGFGLEEATALDEGNLWHFGFHGALPVSASLVEGHERAYIGRWLDRASAKPEGLDPTTRKTFMRAYTAPEAIRGGFEHYATLAEDRRDNQRLIEKGGKLSMPVLVLGGSESLAGRLCNGAPAFASDYTCHAFEGAGHDLPGDVPEAFAQKLIAFLDE